jgi:hypothetical protein
LSRVYSIRGWWSFLAWLTGDETCCFQYDPEQKDNAWNSARQTLQDTKIFHFKSKKAKWCLSHSSTVRESFTKNLFRQVRLWIRNIMWKYCLVWFKELVE